MQDLLELPPRSNKPRETGITHVLDRGLSLVEVGETGITHVLDRGLSLVEVDSLIEVAGDSIDFVKLGWGTALVSANLTHKVQRYREHAIPVMLGGTLTELALVQGRLERLIEWMGELGLEHVEVSDGTITIAHEEKLELIERLSQEFTVLSEVGSKDDTRIMAPYRWVELIQRELAAGAWKVIAEARESGNVGIFRHDGEVRMGLIDEIAHGVAPEQILFEAPRKDQQVWFVRRFGPDVNLGNIFPEDVVSLETIRLGLRSDTALADE